eukprot:2769686-Rhodomonas_salina.1
MRKEKGGRGRETRGEEEVKSCLSRQRSDCSEGISAPATFAPQEVQVPGGLDESQWWYMQSKGEVTFDCLLDCPGLSESPAKKKSSC